MSSSKASNKPRLQRLRASCDGCFLAKVKCSKSRPVCSRCLTYGTDCKYSPSSRVGKPRADRQISNSNINASIANQDINIDKALHSPFVFDSQAISIASDKKKSPVFTFDTNWSISSRSADGSRQRPSSTNTTPSLRNDALLDTCDMGLPSSNSEFFDSSFPWTPIPQNELDRPVFQNDQATMMSRRSLGAVPQLNSFSPWLDGQPSNLPFPPRTNAELPSPNAFFDANSPRDRRTFSKVSSSSCNCFTTCLQSLQALHNHSSTTRSVPAFDVALTINRKAVEGCASMLACSKCVSKSGSNTTAMLLATIMEKIMSFYQVASQSDLGVTTAADAQMSIGTYRVANEDGRWLRIEILWRELRKLEELFGSFREVCERNERNKDAGIYSTLLGHLSQSLNFAYEVLKMRQNSVGGLE